MADQKQLCLSAFQKLRRLQEADECGNVRCISCGKYENYKMVDAGHYISRKFRATSLDHDNVWPQCKYCNHHMHGNIVAYRIKLIEKIGLGRVKRLEEMFSAENGNQESLNGLDNDDYLKVTTKITKQEYEEMAKEYRRQCREIDFYG